MGMRTSAGDLPTLLYIVPFAASAVYAIILWAQNGLSVTLPSSVYLTVTRDPSLFIVGTLAVLLGVMLEVRSTPMDKRGVELISVSNTVQSIAGASLVLVLICAAYANGLDVGGAANDFIVGRYGIVFPALLFLLSYLLRVNFQISAFRSRKFQGIVAMALSPVSLYALGKLKSQADLPAALAFLALGLFLFLWPERKGKSEEV